MFSQCTWFINDGAARDPPETCHTASFHQKNQINGISSSAFKYSLGAGNTTDLVFLPETHSGDFLVGLELLHHWHLAQ